MRKVLLAAIAAIFFLTGNAHATGVMALDVTQTMSRNSNQRFKRVDFTIPSIAASSDQTGVVAITLTGNHYIKITGYGIYSASENLDIYCRAVSNTTYDFKPLFVAEGKDTSGHGYFRDDLAVQTEVTRTVYSSTYGHNNNRVYLYFENEDAVNATGVIKGWITYED